ncbi:Prolyl 4-hydroxylase subunit alpha-2 [Thelohanellus kitauei]|uniref:Prolyl 4-hydroxylase subunit alpha-2 n=1 Tax=Thelohanellus kitauei TaxID=669202 RepID=A0A0C2J5P0_THEKT|nr:Prolyl 4-hydroxylase subunit alpha-2 [Thelohanellus kitauei]
MIFLLMFTLSRLTHSELFTSSLKLCHLLNMELEKLNSLEDLTHEANLNDKFSSMIQKIRQELPKYYFNQPSYPIDDCLDEDSRISRFVTNPVNAYMLIYRFNSVWPELQSVAQAHGNPEIANYSEFLALSPNELKGARDAFYRLQVFYMLEPVHLSDGTLSPEWKSISKSWTIIPKGLTPTDMYEIGRIAFGYKDNESSKAWMLTALKHIQKHDIKNDELVFDILDHLSWSE